MNCSFINSYMALEDIHSHALYILYYFLKGICKKKRFWFLLLHQEKRLNKVVVLTLTLASVRLVHTAISSLVDISG